MTYTLDQIKEIAIPIAKKHGVKRLSLFGSYARGKATDESDLDFYMDKGKIVGWFGYFGFVYDLEDAFHKHVDVVSTTIEDKEFLKSIMSYGKLLYEES